mgnify:CR=1 FL=1
MLFRSPIRLHLDHVSEGLGNLPADVDRAPDHADPHPRPNVPVDGDGACGLDGAAGPTETGEVHPEARPKTTSDVAPNRYGVAPPQRLHHIPAGERAGDNRVGIETGTLMLPVEVEGEVAEAAFAVAVDLDQVNIPANTEVIIIAIVIVIFCPSSFERSTHR